MLAEGVVASYRSVLRRHKVLRGVCLSAAPGTITALVGPNGAGKTTFVSVLTGLLQMDEGTCSIGGLSPRQHVERHGVAFVPETSAFPRGWTPRDLLARAVDLAASGVRATEAFDIAVSRSGLDDHALSRPARRLSKGMERGLMLACALAGDPSLWVLDEPFTGLDARARVSLRREMAAGRTDGATILFASHELAEVGRLADRVFILEDGQARSVGVSAGAGVVELESQLIGRKL